MAVPVTVPRATISMEQGKVVAWLKKVGDAVQVGETLFELETDKALVEVPAPAGGVLLRVLLEQGDAQVESVIGWIGASGETVPDDSKPVEAGPARVVATPAARRRASELGIDLANVSGSGPGGRITQEDVDAAAAMRPTGSRDGLARQLTLAWQTVPHIHICRRLDAGPLVTYRDRANERGLNVTYTDVLLFAVARVLPQFPSLRSIWEGDRLKAGTRMNIGFAVDAPGTVLTPVVEDADRLTLKELAIQRCALTGAAREKRLKSTAAAVFTVTNLGMYGVDLFAPILHLPETAMLAVGRLSQEAMVRDGAVVAGWTVWVNLAVDHRATDGAEAARFLQALERKFADLDPIP